MAQQGALQSFAQQAAVVRNLNEIRNVPIDDLIRQRYERLRRIGTFEEI